MKKTTDQPLSKWYLLRQVILICTTILVSTLSFAQAGDAPMQSLPNFPGPMRIDGFLQRQSAAAGDWLAGPGGATNRVFTDAGVALVPLAYLVTDLFNDQDNDDIFDGGNKLFQDPNVWGWRSQKPPAKDDIATSMIFLALDPITSHIWLAISGDRMSTNGTSYLDFEFYQNEIVKTGGPIPGGTGGFDSDGPHGGRTIGDLSITLEYTAGGSFASVYYLQWQPGSEAGTYDYFPLTVVPGSAFAAANAGVVNVPYGAFGETTYQPLQFVEGAIDLTLLIGGTGFPDQCGGLPFKSLFIKSKSSAERTADLKDFIAPFSINPCFDVTAPSITCPAPLNLGCNPTIPPPSFTGGSASDNCGSVTPVAADGPVTTNGCARSMTRTWRVTDGCGNTATCGQLISWTADNAAPSITTGGTTTTLGCNPSAGDINAALGTATASDACSTASLSSVDGSVGTNGCLRTQTRTWTARDACSGLTSTASRSISWTSDNTGPTITTGGTTTTLGCNPSAGDINGALGTATATDACSTPTLSSVDGSVGTSGCTRTQTRTWTARDACGNTSTASRSISWTADLTGPTITTGGTTTTLGCNPSAGDINAALGTATATDACSTPSITSADGTINTTLCGRSQTRTWTARDVCGNTSTASRTVTWSLDANSPTLTTGGTTTTLGCNPSAGDINGALGTATATDACSTPSLSSVDGPVGTNGCLRTQTRTWTALDACSGLTATASRSISWTADLTGPSITTGGTTTTLGCNPSAGDINAALGTATATDACSTPTLSSVDGSVGTQQCLRSQTRTWTARDVCGNTSTASRTVTWTVDVTGPTITTGGTTTTLGCNPSAGDINGALGTATATDACSTPTLSSVDGSVGTDGCLRTQTRTWTARDVCGNTSTASRSISWTVDVTGPTITTGGTTTTLGCNPSAGDINAALGTATATDACSTPTLSSVDGSVGTNGCLRTQTRTWTARDVCGNTSTASRSISWTADLAGPSITTGGTTTTLGCNPSAGDINAALGTATATDACSTPTLSSVDGSVGTNNCGRNQTRTWTARDACGNTSTASRTVTWTADNTAPVFTSTPASVDIACNAAIPTAATPTASDACGTPTVTQTGNTDNNTDCGTGFGRVVTRTWRAQDACGNTATYTQTIRVACCPTTFCTYTQGAYGTAGGSMCDGENGGFSTLEFIQASLDNWGGSFTVGKPGHSVLVNSAQCVIDKLPGGGAAKELAAADVNLCAFTPLQPNGGVKNILLAQTITLGLNMKIENSQLGGFVLQVGELATQDPLTGCGDETPETRVCHYNVLAPFQLTSVENEYTYRTFTQEVIDAIPGANTIANLYELANRALANVDGVVGFEGGASLGAIADAVGSVNEVFDECKIYIGWNVARCPAIDPTPGDGRVAPTTTTESPVLAVTAYPNPYQENFSLKVNSPVTGQASIGFYTIDGVKISEMKRDVVANRDVWVPFNVPAVYRTRIVYTVAVGSYNAKGVVLSPN